MAKDTSETTPNTASAAAFEDTFAHKAFTKFKKIALYLIILLAVALGISYFSEYKEAQKLDSWNKILQATYSSQVNLSDNFAADIAKATTAIPGTPAEPYGNILVLNSAGNSIDKTQLELAKKAGADFISKNPKHPFIDQVKLDYGTVLFNLGDFAGAVKAYNEVINSKTEYLLQEALLYKGLAQEKLGKDQEAIETYTTIINNSKASDNIGLSSFVNYASFARTQIIDKKVAN